jgi:hypothetical protein
VFSGRNYANGDHYGKREETLTEDQQANSNRATTATIAFLRGLPGNVLASRIAKDFQDKSKAVPRKPLLGEGINHGRLLNSLPGVTRVWDIKKHPAQVGKRAETDTGETAGTRRQQVREEIGCCRTTHRGMED